MNYLLLILTLIISLIYYLYIQKLNKVNNNIEILQTPPEPTFEIIQKTLSEKLPTVFKGVLYDCDPICDIFDLDLNAINELSDPKQPYFKQLLIAFLAPYSLPFNSNWIYKFNETHIKNKNENNEYEINNDTPQYYTFIKENHHRHFICQITGQQRIYLASHLQEKNINSNQQNTQYHNKRYNPKLNFFSIKNDELEKYKDIKYIEIILREGNMLYIPKDWYYIQDYEKDNNFNKNTNNDKPSNLTELEQSINEKNLTMDLYLNSWI